MALPILPLFPSSDPYINGVRGGFAWVGDLTFSFPQSPEDYPLIYTGAFAWQDTFQPVSEHQQEAVRAILTGQTLSGEDHVITTTSVASFTNLTISEVSGGAGDIRVGQQTFFEFPDWTQIEIQNTAYAQFPNPILMDSAGDVWFGTAIDWSNPDPGTYEYYTHIHELGHSLGLKHPHEGFVMPPPFGAVLFTMPPDRDGLEFAVMSYRDYPGDAVDGVGSADFPQTFMMYDILALQTMYGADYGPGSNNTDTVYKWLPNTGETFINGVSQGIPQDNTIFLTIWDGGGIDTYDMSSYTRDDVTIDLRPGSWSIAAHGQDPLGTDQLPVLEDGVRANGSIYNALLFNFDTRSLIENALGGFGNDTLIGNQTTNQLFGNGGNDTLFGREGDDTLVGGPGNDTLAGGLTADFTELRGPNGTDSAWFTGNFADYSFFQNADGSLRVTDTRAFSPDGTDTLYSVEILEFPVETLIVQQGVISGDLMIGDDSTNWLDGFGSQDLIDGRGGNDLIIGGTGNDTLLGGDGDDFIFDAEGGDDNLQGGPGNDTLGDPHNTNILDGGSGDDLLFAGFQNDTLIGGDGNDTVSYEYRTFPPPAGQTEGVTVNLALTGAQGTVVMGFDTLSGIENVTGTIWDDTLTGSSGDNVLNGLDGVDVLTGGGGNDTLIGGLGVDTAVYSGRSIDYLITRTGAFSLSIADGRAGSPDGTDTVSGVDSFQFAGTTLSFAALLAHPPVIISGGGGPTANVSVAENSRAVTTVSAIDPNAGQTLGYSIVGGADRTQFNINTATGALVFLSDPDYERPSDVNEDNVYEVIVQASDGAQTDSQTIFVTVTDVPSPETRNGDSGDNTFVAGPDTENISGGGGLDTVSYAAAPAGVTASLQDPTTNTGWAAGDTYDSIENLIGSAFDDKLIGNSNDNILEGGAGADRLNGRQGVDTASYEHATAGVTADLSKPTNNTGDAAGDIYQAIENLLGSSFNDQLVGDGSSNVLSGGRGQDILIGNNGDDTLIGGRGNDILTGGGQNDTFVFDSSNFGRDIITDFRIGNAVNHDTLDLRGLGFESLQDVWDNTTEDGSDAVIHSVEDTITLQGVTLAQLQSHPDAILV